MKLDYAIMSRGRGRGRGRGGSNAARDNFNAAFKDMSKEDSRALFESFSKPVKGSGMLYPPLEKASELPGMTPLEERVVAHTNEMLRDIAEGPVGPNGQRTGAPWRLASERKVVGIGELPVVSTVVVATDSLEVAIGPKTC